MKAVIGYEFCLKCAFGFEIGYIDLGKDPFPTPSYDQSSSKKEFKAASQYFAVTGTAPKLWQRPIALQGRVGMGGTAVLSRTAGQSWEPVHFGGDPLPFYVGLTARYHWSSHFATGFDLDLVSGAHTLGMSNRWQF